jgi:branched-chain amino acid transport system substrate-binding protein
MEKSIAARRSLSLRVNYLLAAALCLAAAAPAQGEEKYKIGVVVFLSGPAAESYGVPATNALKVVLDAVNKGNAPAPYDKRGFGGLTVETVSVDEAGGATKQVQELRNLYQRENVDAVVGYNGSGDCLAVAPAAEEMKKFLVLYDCGSPRVLEEASYKYVFRTASHSAMDNVALVHYLKARNLKTDSVNLINPDYAYGQDARADFVASLRHTRPSYKIAADLLPSFGAGQYGTEISALSRQPADVIYSSLWGGDLQAFILQASPRGLFKRSPLILPAGDHVLQTLGEKMPEGTIIGARGAYGVLATKNPLNDWFWKAYQSAYGATAIPTQGSYRMVQSLLGMKLAVEKAMARNGGKKPSSEEVAGALRGLEWDSPGGRIQMTLASGQQAIQPTAIGRTHYDPARKMVVATDIQFFKAECVNPPPNVKSLDWIKAGFPGARCD